MKDTFIVFYNRAALRESNKLYNISCVNNWYSWKTPSLFFTIALHCEKVINYTTYRALTTGIFERHLHCFFTIALHWEKVINYTTYRVLTTGILERHLHCFFTIALHCEKVINYTTYRVFCRCSAKRHNCTANGIRENVLKWFFLPISVVKMVKIGDGAK